MVSIYNTFPISSGYCPLSSSPQTTAVNFSELQVISIYLITQIVFFNSFFFISHLMVIYTVRPQCPSAGSFRGLLPIA